MRVKAGPNLIITGYAAKDADLRFVGDKQTPLCFFSVNTGKGADGKGVFVNCKAWGDLAITAGCIAKYDSLMVTGTFAVETGKDGKTYENLTADFFWNMAWGAPSSKTSAQGYDYEAEGFGVLSGDDDPPF